MHTVGTSTSTATSTSVLARAAAPRSPRDLDDFCAYHATRDPLLRDALVVRHVGLARSMAQRYASRGIEFDDLLQVAIVGLIVSIDRFDPTRGVAFSSFAVPTILGEVKRHFRDTGWTIRVPRRLQDLRRTAQDAGRRLEQELGRTPRPEEVARDLDEPVESVVEALALGGCFQPGPLDDGVRMPADVQASHDVAACSRVEVARLLALLPEREQKIFVLRYYGGLTQQEIADRVGMSQMHVSRLLRAGLQTLQARSA